MPARKRSSLVLRHRPSSLRHAPAPDGDISACSPGSSSGTPVTSPGRGTKRRRLSNRLKNIGSDHDESKMAKNCKDSKPPVVGKATAAKRRSSSKIDDVDDAAVYTAEGEEDDDEFWSSDAPIPTHIKHEEEVPSIDLATPTPSVSLSEAEDASCEEEVVRSDDIEEDEEEVDEATLTQSKPTLSAEHLEKVKSIISQQFDLEILLKHRELRSIEDELAKTQVMMLQLRQHSENPSQHISGDPESFVHKYSKFLKPPVLNKCVCGSQSTTSSSYSMSAGLDELHYSSSSSSSTGYYHTRRSSLSSLSLRPPPAATPVSTGCLYRRPDGTVVKLVCPECHRSNFGSVQGFINHCRISHELEFTSHDAAAAKCGVKLDSDPATNANSGGDNLTRQRSYSSITPPPTSSLSHVKHVEFASEIEVSNGFGPRGANNNTNTNTDTTKSNTKSLKDQQQPQQKKPSVIANLARFLQTNDIQLDIDQLVAQATERVHKGYLFDGEEDFVEPEIELTDEASTFERVLAEARKLNLNVDEIRAAALQASKTRNEASEKKRKRKGSESTPPNHNQNHQSPGDKQNQKHGQNQNQASTENQPKSHSKTSPDTTAAAVTAQNNSQLAAQTNRRMPSEVKPLVTRSKARAQQKGLHGESSELDHLRRPPTPPLGDDTPTSSKRKEMKMIGNFSKYIPRFF